LSQTQQQAQEILRQAQLAAEQQDAEIKQKYSVEVEKRLAQAELIKATAPEQIKPQGLRSNAVPLKTEPKVTSKQATARLRLRESHEARTPNSKISSGWGKGSASAASLPQDSSPQISEESSSKKRPSKNELVVGLELDGCAKAYPVQLAAGRKIINDTVAGEDVLVAFGRPSEPGMIFKRRVDGRSLPFVPLPEANSGLMLMKDEETGTTWEALSGRAISGVLAPKELQRLISEYSF
jgi:hypothetical protein